MQGATAGDAKLIDRLIAAALVTLALAAPDLARGQASAQVRDVTVGGVTYKQTQPRAWTKFYADGGPSSVILLETRRLADKIELLDLAGSHMCLDIANRLAWFHSDCDSAGSGQNAPLTYGHGVAPRPPALDDLDRVAAVRTLVFDFERDGAGWRITRGNPPDGFARRFREVGRGAASITLSGTDGRGGAVMDLSENRVFFEGDRHPPFTEVVEVLLAELPDDPLFTPLTLGEAMRTRAVVQLRWGTTSRTARWRDGALVLASPRSGEGAEAEAAAFRMTLEPVAGGPTGAFRVRNPVSGDYAVDVRGELRVTSDAANATTFVADPTTTAIDIRALDSGRIWTDRSRNGPIETLRARFAGAGFTIHREVRDVLRVEVAADEGGRPMTPADLIRRLGVTFTERDGTLHPVAPAWTPGGAATRPGYATFEADLSGASVAGTRLGAVTRVSLTNGNPSDNIRVGDVQFRNFELFRCDCVVNPAASAVSPEHVVSVREQAARKAIDDGAALRAGVIDRRAAAMAGTPGFKRVGAELFDFYLATDRERIALDAFLTRYAGDFMADFLALDAESPPREINVETVRAAFADLRSRLGAGAQDPDAVALDVVRTVVLDGVEARRRLLVLVDRTRRAIEAKYEVAQNEIDVFREYAKITNPAATPVPTDSIVDQMVATAWMIGGLSPGLLPQIGAQLTYSVSALALIDLLARTVTSLDAEDPVPAPVAAVPPYVATETSAAVTNAIVSGANRLQAELQAEETRDMRRLDALARSSLADLALLDRAARAGAIGEAVVLEPSVADAVRQRVWAALLPLRVSLVGTPGFEETSPRTGAAAPATLSMARLDAALGRATACFDGKAGCRVDIGPERAIFYSQMPPVQYFRTDGAMLLAWRLVARPWRLGHDVEDKNDAVNFGRSTISIARDGAVSSMSLNAYLMRLFGTPATLAGVFDAANERWVHYPFMDTQTQSMSSFAATGLAPARGDRIGRTGWQAGSTWTQRTSGTVGSYPYVQQNVINVGNVPMRRLRRGSLENPAFLARDVTLDIGGVNFGAKNLRNYVAFHFPSVRYVWKDEAGAWRTEMVWPYVGCDAPGAAGDALAMECRP